MFSLVDMIHAATSDFVDQFQGIHCVVGIVCLAGILMAYMSDPEHTKKYASYVLHTRSSTKKDSETDASSSSVLESIIYMVSDVLRAFQRGDILRRICDKTNDWLNFLQFIWAARSLKSAAKSRRQFSYMMEKRLLGLTIDRNESEVKSYLDVKRHLGAQFPFMWKVSEVKEEEIECEGHKCHPMSSYSYLDLLRSEEVQNSAIEAAKQYSSGNHGPRMLGGNMRILVELEQVISDFFGRDATLLCATGFLACMSGICALAHERDVVFSDSRAHASLRAGMKLSGAKIINFKHNDYAHAEKLIRKHRKKYNGAWMVIESVYSMDGDLADLPAAHAIAQKYDINIILDEAHGLGVVGHTGRGLEEHYGMPGAATIICGTFSKSIASIGGYISGPKDLIDFMDFHAPGNVFSAPLPAYCAGAALKSFELMTTESWRIGKARENSLYLREALSSGLGLWPQDFKDNDKYELEGDPATTVIPVVFPDDVDRMMRIATILRRKGFMVSAVAFPACPLRRPRFRITGTSAYTPKIINEFVTTLVNATIEEPPSEVRGHMKMISSALN